MDNHKLVWRICWTDWNLMIGIYHYYGLVILKFISHFGLDFRWIAQTCWIVAWARPAQKSWHWFDYFKVWNERAWWWLKENYRFLSNKNLLQPEFESGVFPARDELQYRPLYYTVAFCVYSPAIYCFYLWAKPVALLNHAACEWRYYPPLTLQLLSRAVLHPQDLIITSDD